MSKTIIVPTNPADQKTILDAIKEMDSSMYRMEAERDLIKQIIDDLAEKFEDLDKKNIRKMARVYHKQNFTTVESENEDFVELYTTIVGV